MPPRARLAWFSSLRTEYREDILSSLNIQKIRELVISGDEAGLQNALEKVEDEKCTERDWKWRGKEGRTVLELAAMLGRSKVVRLLLSAGAPPNVVSTSGYGGLHFACIWGQLCCVRELVNGGGDHCLATEYNETPQQLALRYGNTDCAQFLSCVEARQKLCEAIQVGRDTLADQDLIAGKWNKDDKSKVNSMCAEKSEWLSQHGDCSEEEATQQTVEFHLRMQPYLDKLQPLTL